MVFCYCWAITLHILAEKHLCLFLFWPAGWGLGPSIIFRDQTPSRAARPGKRSGVFARLSAVERGAWWDTIERIAVDLVLSIFSNAPCLKFMFICSGTTEIMNSLWIEFRSTVSEIRLEGCSYARLRWLGWSLIWQGKATLKLMCAYAHTRTHALRPLLFTFRDCLKSTIWPHTHTHTHTYTLIFIPTCTCMEIYTETNSWHTTLPHPCNRIHTHTHTHTHTHIRLAHTHQTHTHTHQTRTHTSDTHTPSYSRPSPLWDAAVVSPPDLPAEPLC